MVEGTRPFLSPTGNPRELSLDTEASGENDLRNILSIFVESTSLWFRVEYSLGGVRLAIEPEDFMAARSGPSIGRDKFLRDKPQELLGGTRVIVTIINPNRHERPRA